MPHPAMYDAGVMVLSTPAESALALPPGSPCGSFRREAPFSKFGFLGSLSPS